MNSKIFISHVIADLPNIYQQIILDSDIHRIFFFILNNKKSNSNELHHNISLNKINLHKINYNSKILNKNPKSIKLHSK